MLMLGKFSIDGAESLLTTQLCNLLIGVESRYVK